MKSLHELAETDRGLRTGEFASLVRHLARARGSLVDATDLAAGARAPQRVVDCLKAAVNAGGLTEWGTQTTQFRLMADAFVDSLRWSSVFFRMLGDGGLIRLPFKVRVGSVITGVGAGIISAGQAIPVKRMDLESVELPRQKVGAIVSLTREVLDSGTAAESLISRSLRSSVSLAVDAAVVSQLTTGAVSIAATSTPLADLASLLSAIDPTPDSRLYLLAAPDVAIRMATLGSALGIGSPTQMNSGQRLFPDASPVGGSVLGIPLVVSSAVTAGQLILVDASGIGGASDGVELSAGEPDLQMDDAPTMSGGVGSPEAPVPTAVVSMWQVNAVAIRCISFFGLAKLRRGGVAVLTSVGW
jgi:hypothetical protein